MPPTPAPPVLTVMSRSRFVMLTLAVALAASLGVQVWPWLSARLPTRGATATHSLPTLVIPAVADQEYRYLRRNGDLALLRSAQGETLRFPALWLPRDARPGDTLSGISNISPGTTETTFSLRLTRVASSEETRKGNEER